MSESVGSLDRSVEWYSRFFETPPVLRKVWDIEYVGRMLGIPGVKIECAFWELPGGTPLELDLEAELGRLERELGVTGVDAVEIPWGPYVGGSRCYISRQLMQLPLDGPRFAE
jgi:hypothetical protein